MAVLSEPIDSDKTSKNAIKFAKNINMRKAEAFGAVARTIRDRHRYTAEGIFSASHFFFLVFINILFFLVFTTSTSAGLQGKKNIDD